MFLYRIAYYSHLRKLNSKIITYPQFECVRKQAKHTFEIIPSHENAIARDYMINSGKYVLWPTASNSYWIKFLPTQSHQTHQKQKNQQYRNKHMDDMHLKLINNFKFILEVSRTSSIDNKSDAFGPIYQQLINSAPKFSEFNLIEILKLLSEITIDPNVSTLDKIGALRMALSNECEIRSKQWDINHLFLMCDIWYGIPMGQHTHFLQVACEFFAQHANELTREQLVQALFYLNWRRRPVRHMISFEQQLIRHLPHLNLNELSIVAMGFIKTNTIIRSSNLIGNIYEKLLEEDLRILPEVSLTAIVKMLRVSSQWNIHNKFNAALQKKLFWHAENQSILTALHIALLGTTVYVVNHQLIEMIVHRFISHINELRLKDMERIVWVLAVFDFKSTTGASIKLLEAIVNELPKRFAEIHKYTQSYIMCTYYLALRGFANTNLIAYCLTPAHLDKVYGKIWYYPRELLFLDSYTRINLKNVYAGHQLNIAQRKILTERLRNEAAEGELNNIAKLEANVVASVRKLYTYFILGHALPHYANTDIYVIIDKRTRCAIDPTQHFATDRVELILTKKMVTANESNLEVFVISIGLERQYFESEGNYQLTGYFQCKLDQLKLLGFHPIVIPHFKWKTLDHIKRDAFIAQNINAVLDHQ